MCIYSQTTIQLFLLIFSFYLISTKPTSNELNCDEEPQYKNFEITTNFNENSDLFDIPVINNCQVDNKWKVKEDKVRQCEIPHRVFEGEDNIRRPFRLTNRRSATSEKITIQSITMDYPKDIAETTLTKPGMITLYPGDSVDVYVDYDCLDMNEGKYVPSNWFKLRINITFDNGNTKSFEYMKICTATYADTLDFSHFVIIGIIFLVIFASVKDQLRSKMEDEIVTKSPEIKNPENLLIIFFVTGLILIFLNVVNILDSWVYIALLLVGPISISLIIEAILTQQNILTHLQNKTFELSYLGSISLFQIACLAVGYFIHLIWLQSHNWLINNIVSICISIITIRIFKLTSFKFIVLIYIIAFVYDYMWVAYRSNNYGENYKLTNSMTENLPIRILCPELVSSPFRACSSLSIADIILPGIFLSYLKKFDELKVIDHYFKIGLYSLAAGLIVNLFVYYTNLLPTPSFLFTGPIILLATLIVAYRKQDLYEFIEGFPSTAYENKLEKNISSIAQLERRNNNQDYQPPIEMRDYS